MKKCLVVCLCAAVLFGFLSGGRAEESDPLPQAVMDVCREHYKGYSLSHHSGFGNEQQGRWALVLSREGQHVLLVAEKTRDEPAYRITIQNSRAIMPGDSQPNVLIDTGGDVLFVSFRKEETWWSFHSVKKNGQWSDVDLALHIHNPGSVSHEEWQMFVQEGMLFSEHLTTDSNDNILETYDYPPIPVPQMQGRLHPGTYDWQMFPQNPAWLITRETSSPETLSALTPRGWTLDQAEISTAGISLLGKDERGKTRLLLKRWMSTEEDKTRGSYRDTLSLPLPEEAWIKNTSLHLSPSGPGFTLDHAPSGGWLLRFIMGEDWFEAHPTFLCLDRGDITRYAYGNLHFDEVDRLDFSALPLTYREAFRLLDQSGWAMVNNPNPKDRLHLREKPQKDSTSLGKFYNGTPLKVLERKGKWVKVSISQLTGWMMADYLAFGSDMNQVHPAFPTWVGLESLGEKPMPLYTRPDENSPVAFRRAIGYHREHDYRIAGVVGEEWFYIYYVREDIGGYVKQEWFWEGNG